MLFDGQGEIVRQPLKDFYGSEGAYRYEFEVATNLMAHSQFILRDFGNVDTAKGAGDSFWFFLKDFWRPEAANKRR